MGSRRREDRSGRVRHGEGKLVLRNRNADRPRLVRPDPQSRSVERHAVRHVAGERDVEEVRLGIQADFERLSLRGPLRRKRRGPARRHGDVDPVFRPPIPNEGRIVFHREGKRGARAACRDAARPRPARAGPARFPARRRRRRRDARRDRRPPDNFVRSGRRRRRPVRTFHDECLAGNPAHAVEIGRSARRRPALERPPQHVPARGEFEFVRRPGRRRARDLPRLRVVQPEPRVVAPVCVDPPRERKPPRTRHLRLQRARPALCDLAAADRETVRRRGVRHRRPRRVSGQGQPQLLAARGTAAQPHLPLPEPRDRRIRRCRERHVRSRAALGHGARPRPARADVSDVRAGRIRRRTPGRAVDIGAVSNAMLSGRRGRRATVGCHRQRDEAVADDGTAGRDRRFFSGICVR